MGNSSEKQCPAGVKGARAETNLVLRLLDAKLAPKALRAVALRRVRLDSAHVVISKGALDTGSIEQGGEVVVWNTCLRPTFAPTNLVGALGLAILAAKTLEIAIADSSNGERRNTMQVQKQEPRTAGLHTFLLSVTEAWAAVLVSAS